MQMSDSGMISQEQRTRWNFLAPSIALLAVSLAICWVPSPVCAQVFRIQGQGTAASGMGNAFAAQADDQIGRAHV